LSCNCDNLWEKKQPGKPWAWFWDLIWRICGCRTPKVTIEICTVSGKRPNQYCREAGTVEEREFNEGTQPPENDICQEHTEPIPPPGWTGKVCKESTKRKASKYCIQIHEVTLPERPPVCDLHPPITNPDPIHDIHAHWLGDWNWWRVEAWEEKDQERLERELRDQLIALRGRGIKVKDSFGWLCSGRQEHRHLNTKTPWKWERSNGKMVFHLDQWDPRYWELFERYLELHKIGDIDFEKHLFMGFGYNKYPFENNFNGVRRFLEFGKPMDQQPALPFQLAFAKKTIQTYKKVYGENYNPWIKFINEPAHAGSGSKFHDWMYWHEAMYRGELETETLLSRCVFDMSACEGVLGEIREPHLCPKQGACDKKIEMTVVQIDPANTRMRVADPVHNKKYWTEYQAGLGVGDKVELGVHGEQRFDREGMGEFHGFSTKTDFGPEEPGGRPRIVIYYGSANKRRKFTEDAGGHAKDGRGPVWGPYIWGDAEQQYEMTDYIYGLGANSNKQVVFGSFAIECLFELEEDGKKIFKSFYTLENLEKKQGNGESYFDRLDAQIRGWAKHNRPA